MTTEGILSVLRTSLYDRETRGENAPTAGNCELEVVALKGKIPQVNVLRMKQQGIALIANEHVRLPHSASRIQKSGCAPTFESYLNASAHHTDRDQSATQTASLIAASFRT